MIVVPVAIRAQVLIAVVFGDKLNTDKLEFGLMVSPCLTNITGLPGTVKPGLNLGLYFNIKISDRLFLSPQAVAKGTFGAWGLFNGGSVQRVIQSMGLPLLVHYRIAGRLFAEGGVQVDLLLKGKDNFKTDVQGSQLTYALKISDQLTTLDAGVTGGLLYKIKKDKGMGIGVRYLRGLTDILKSQPGTQVNSVWLLNVTIPIGAQSSKNAGNKQ
jgi:hypothetical protein